MVFGKVVLQVILIAKINMATMTISYTHFSTLNIDCMVRSISVELNFMINKITCVSPNFIPPTFNIYINDPRGLYLF